MNVYDLFHGAAGVRKIPQNLQMHSCRSRFEFWEQSCSGTPVGNQILLLKDKQVEDSDTLESFDISSSATFILLRRAPLLSGAINREDLEHLLQDMFGCTCVLHTCIWLPYRTTSLFSRPSRLTAMTCSTCPQTLQQCLGKLWRALLQVGQFQTCRMARRTSGRNFWLIQAKLDRSHSQGLSVPGSRKFPRAFLVSRDRNLILGTCRTMPALFLFLHKQGWRVKKIQAATLRGCSLRATLLQFLKEVRA